MGSYHAARLQQLRLVAVVTAFSAAVKSGGLGTPLGCSGNKGCSLGMPRGHSGWMVQIPESPAPPGPVYVHEVQYGLLAREARPGDHVIAVDDNIVLGLTATELSRVLVSRGE